MKEHYRKKNIKNNKKIKDSFMDLYEVFVTLGVKIDISNIDKYLESYSINKYDGPKF